MLSISRRGRYATAALAVTTTAAVLWSAAGATATPPRRLVLTATNVASALFIPCSKCVLASTPAGAHIGGTEIDAGTLSDASGDAVGHFALESVGVTPFGADGAGELQQTATIVLGHDQLTTQGLEEPPLDGGVAAITGGTGRYAHARGEVRYRDNPDDTTTLTIIVSG